VWSLQNHVPFLSNCSVKLLLINVNSKKVLLWLQVQDLNAALYSRQKSAEVKLYETWMMPKEKKKKRCYELHIKIFIY
jgi:hypothetical protein